MSTPELERLVRRALHTEAENAMNSTDTQAQLGVLVRNAKQEDRRRLLSRSAGAAVMAAATVTAALVWWPGQDGSDPAPSEQPDSMTQAEQVASDLVDAYAAFDWDGFNSLLAADSIVRADQGEGRKLLRRQMLRDQAQGLDIVEHECSETATLVDESVQVACLYSSHLLRSEDLGRGPYDGSLFSITVRNDEVTSYSDERAETVNGMAEVFDPFLAWLSRTHPEDMELYAVGEDPDADQATVARSNRLIQRLVDEWTEAVLAGKEDLP